MYNQSSQSFVLKGALCLCLLAACLPANVNAILNGANAIIDDFPEMVQLRYKGSFVCAGFLITDRYVVTAAQCIVDDVDCKTLKIIANVTYTMEAGIERNIEVFYVPEGFNNQSHLWDMAVIKLKEPVPLGKGIQVAKMADTHWGKKEILRIAGWGVTEVEGSPAEQLMTANVSTISDDKCKQRMDKLKDEENIFKNYNFTDTISCALAKGHVDACYGDAGGPAYIGTKVSGIVSAGIGCGHGKLPSSYTSIAKTRNFINAALCYEASVVEIENLKVFIPNLSCHAAPNVNVDIPVTPVT